MDIRKADSKGRVTGFEPGKYYEVGRDSKGHLHLRPVGDWDKDIQVNLPAPESAVDYLRDHGIDPKDVCTVGVSPSGYYRRVPNLEPVRVPWPDGFDFLEFQSRVNWSP